VLGDGSGEGLGRAVRDAFEPWGLRPEVGVARGSEEKLTMVVVRP